MSLHDELDAALKAQDALVARVAQLHERNMELRDALERYQALFYGRLGNMEHMSTQEFRTAHLTAYLHAKEALTNGDAYA